MCRASSTSWRPRPSRAGRGGSPAPPGALSVSGCSTRPPPRLLVPSRGPSPHLAPEIDSADKVLPQRKPSPDIVACSRREQATILPVTGLPHGGPAELRLALPERSSAQDPGRGSGEAWQVPEVGSRSVSHAAERG